MIRISDLPKRFCTNKGRSSHASAIVRDMVKTTTIQQGQGPARPSLLLLQRAAAGPRSQRAR